MNTQIMKVTLKALVPSRGMYYFWLFFLSIIYLSASFAYGPHIHILLYLILMYFFAYLSGSLLMDILVKPLSLCLPSLQATLPWVILAAGIIYGMLCAVPMMFVGPSAVVEGTGLSFIGLLLLGNAMFHIVVLICFRLKSTFLMFSLFMCLFILGPNPYLARTFEGLMLENSAIAFIPWIMITVSLFLVFHATREKGFRRQLSGKTVLTFADMGSPLRAVRVMNRMKQEVLMREAAYVEQPLKGPALNISRIGNKDLAALCEDLGLYFRRTNWKYALLNLLFFTVVISLANGMLFITRSPALLLLFPLFILYEQFYTFYWRHFSPMLPIGRELHFRIGLYKGLCVYLFTVVIYLALLGSLRMLFLVLPAPADRIVEPLATIPFKGALYFGLAAPVVSWIFIFIRNMSGYLVLMMIFAFSCIFITMTLFDNFLLLPPVLIFLLTLLLFAPFVLQTHINCFKSDLIRSA